MPGRQVLLRYVAVRADVAQLVEQRFCKPPVPGSSPVVGSKRTKPDRPGHHDAAALPDRRVSRG